jgi:DNA-binding PadR family transcriptional regulator
LKDVETLSGGRVKLSTGTLYGALARLLDQGLIQKSAEDETEAAIPSDAGSGEPRVRKYYELTQVGRRVLKKELHRLQALLAAARQELGREGL